MALDLQVLGKVNKSIADQSPIVFFSDSVDQRNVEGWVYQLHGPPSVSAVLIVQYQIIDPIKVSRLLALKISEYLAIKHLTNTAKKVIEMEIRRQIDGAVALLL